MNVGTRVHWKSQAAGFTKEKEGTIVAVVAAGHSAVEVARTLNEQAGYIYSNFDSLYGGAPRKHESYLVLVPNKVKRGGKLYWPRVSALRTFLLDTPGL